METITSGKDIFQIVDFVPSGHHIWNIGKNMIDGYLPLVQLGGYDGYQVVGVKKAIKIEGAQTILAAIGWGQGTIKEMETYIKRYKNSKRQVTLNHVKRLEEALKVMYLIKCN